MTTTMGFVLILLGILLIVVSIAGFIKLSMPRPGFWYDQIIAWLVPFIALIGGFALIFAGARAYAPDNMLLRQFSLTDPVTGRRLEGAVTQPLTY